MAGCVLEVAATVGVAEVFMAGGELEILLGRVEDDWESEVVVEVDGV